MLVLIGPGGRSSGASQPAWACFVLARPLGRRPAARRKPFLGAASRAYLRSSCRRCRHIHNFELAHKAASSPSPRWYPHSQLASHKTHPTELSQPLRGCLVDCWPICRPLKSSSSSLPTTMPTALGALPSQPPPARRDYLSQPTGWPTAHPFDLWLASKPFQMCLGLQSLAGPPLPARTMAGGRQRLQRCQSRRPEPHRRPLCT